MHYHKGWLANVIGFVGVQLENLLITQYEGPHTDDIAVTEAEAYIFALDLLDRNTSQLEDLKLCQIQVLVTVMLFIC